MTPIFLRVTYDNIQNIVCIAWFGQIMCPKGRHRALNNLQAQVYLSLRWLRKFTARQATVDTFCLKLE